MSVKNYPEFLRKLNEEIQISQLEAAISLNCELLEFYWEIGSFIQAKQKESDDAIPIENIARELRCDFPNIKGFSGTNIYFMIQFFKEYADKEIIRQLVGFIPWEHNIILFQKIPKKEERFWYIYKTTLNGWNKEHLVHWINRDLYKKKGRIITHFQKSLPPLQSDLVQEILTDRYCFDFLTFINIRKCQNRGTKLIYRNSNLINHDISYKYDLFYKHLSTI